MLVLVVAAQLSGFLSYYVSAAVDAMADTVVLAATISSGFLYSYAAVVVAVLVLAILDAAKQKKRKHSVFGLEIMLSDRV